MAHSGSHLLPAAQMGVLVQLAEDVVRPRLRPRSQRKPRSSRVWRTDSVHVAKELSGASNEVVWSDSSDGS